VNHHRFATVLVLTGSVTLAIPPAIASPSSAPGSAAAVYVVQALSQGDVKLSVDNKSLVRVLGAKDVL
jgi:hypothetical protein